MLFEKSEAELIGSAMNGDSAAFADLIRPQYAAAFCVAYRLLRDVYEIATTSTVIWAVESKADLMEEW